MKTFNQYLTEHTNSFDVLFAHLESLYYQNKVHNVIVYKRRNTATIWFSDMKTAKSTKKLIETQYSHLLSEPLWFNDSFANSDITHMVAAITLNLTPETTASMKRGEAYYRLKEKLLWSVRTEESTNQQDYIKSLQLKLSKDDLTDAQLNDFARRSNGIPSSPNQLSAIADIDAMSPNHLEQIIKHKRVHVFMKHRARQRLTGKWK